jgi:hypothetical protein
LDAETSPQNEVRVLKHRWVQPLLLIGVSLYLYTNLFALPNTPFYFEGDQVWFRTNALRMLYGEKIYQDFFQFTPPGTDLFFLTLLKLFGSHMWVMNAAVLILGIALCCICFSLAKLLMERPLALLATALFLVLVYGRLMDATHHWFSVLAVMCAVGIVMPRVTAPRIACAGALLGVALFFTQTTGAAGALGLLLFLIWEGRSTGRPWRTILAFQLVLVMAFGLALGALGAYFVVTVGWKQLWYFLVVYSNQFALYASHTIFPAIPRRLRWRGLFDLGEYLFVYALVVLIYPAVLSYCFPKRGKPVSQETVRLVLISLVGLSLLLEVITRTNRIRLYSISMPALILAVWAITHAGRLQRYVTAAVWIIVACLAIQQTRSRYRQNSQITELPSGKTALPAERYEQFSWLMEHTRPGDYLFQSAWPNLYFPLDLRSPVFVDQLATTEVTRPEWVALTVQQLEDKRVQYIFWSPSLNVPLDPSRPWEDHLGPFRTYLKSHYTRVHVFPGQDAFEIWERN